MLLTMIHGGCGHQETEASRRTNRYCFNLYLVSQLGRRMKKVKPHSLLSEWLFLGSFILLQSSL